MDYLEFSKKFSNLNCRPKDGKRLSADDLKIRCGEYDRKSNAIELFKHQEREVDTFTLHPLYSKTSYRNDLAVIHTTEAFKQAPNVNTICLPKPDSPFSEAICTSMGWGVNSEDTNAIGVDIMKQVRLNRVTNRTQCEETIMATEKVSKTWELDNSWICAEALQDNNDNVLCQGDGGGPLVCQEQGTNRYIQKTYFFKAKQNKK